MNSLIDTPLASEKKKILPGVVLFPGTEVLPPNLIKEDEMEMIDPEDPQLLSGKENKNQKPDTMVQPLNFPANRNQRIYNCLEYIAILSSLFFGAVMLCYYMPINQKCKHHPFTDLIGFVIVMMMGECIFLLWTYFCTCCECAAEFRDVIQVLALTFFTNLIRLDSNFTLDTPIGDSGNTHIDDQDKKHRLLQQQVSYYTSYNSRRDAYKEYEVDNYTVCFRWSFGIITIFQIGYMAIKYRHKTTTAHAPNIKK